MQVEEGAAELVRHRDGQFGGAQQFVGSVVVGEAPADVAGHRGEPGAGGRERVDVLGGPVPDLHGEAELVDPPDALQVGSVEKEHLGRGREGESGAGHAGSTSLIRTGRLVLTDSMAARATVSAARASSPVTSGGDPERTAAMKPASSLV